MNNPRIIHLLLGGHNTGKTTLARFLQVGKHNIFRIAIDELIDSTGMTNVDEWFYSLCHLFLIQGDIVIDDVIHNRAVARRKLLGNLSNRELGYVVYAYVVKREIENCFDEYHDQEEVVDSHQIEYPKLSEGIEKILSVSWENSKEAVSYGDEIVAMRPRISVVEEAPPSIIVRSKRRVSKNKLRRGKQNILMPRPKNGK